MFKRFLSMFLALIMVTGIFPVSVFATEEENPLVERSSYIVERYHENFEPIYSNGKITYSYCGNKTTAEEIAEQLGAGDGKVKRFVTLLKIPEGYSGVEKFYDDEGDKTSEWQKFDESFVNVESGWITLLPISYMDADMPVNSERTFKITWTDGEGKTAEETIVIATDYPVLDSEENTGVFEGKTQKIGSNIEFFETVYSGSKVTYRYSGTKTTEEEIAEEFGADERSSKGLITALRIPEGYTDVEEYIENGNNSVSGWKEFAAEFTDLNGYIPLWPVAYTDGLDIIESERTFTIVWKNENGGTFEETITVVTDFGDIELNGDEEIVPEGARPLVERARLVLGGCEEFFDKGRNGTEIVYTYNVEEDDTREKVLERLLQNNDGESGFEVRLDSPDPSIYTTVEEVRIWDEDITSDFISEPGERITSLNLGRVWFTTMVNNLCESWRGEFTVIWSNGKTGNEQMTYMESGIAFSLKFPVLENYPWMSTYNNPLESGRIEVVNSEGTKITAGGEAVDGLSVKGYENGKLSLEYLSPAEGSEETFSVSIKAPDGAAYYRVLTGKEFIGYNPDKEGEYDSTLDWEVESVSLGTDGKFDIKIELGKVGQSHKFVDGINVWYNSDSVEDFEKQVAVIKWYGEGGTLDDDLFKNEYFYIDVEYQEEEKSAVPGVEEVTGKVTAPIIEGGSKAGIVFGETEQNIFPENTEESGRYYFILKTEETLQQGEKVYIPYDFISEEMNSEKAENLDISIRNLDGESANTSGIEYDEFGMYFYTDALGEFVLSWDKKLGEDEERRFIEDFYKYWREGEWVNKNQISLHAHPAILDYMSVEFVDEVFVVTVEDIPLEKWKEVYYSLDQGDLLIGAEIHIAPPRDDLPLVSFLNGNGGYEMIKNQLNSGIEDGFGENEYALGFEDIAQVEVKEDKITIIPRDSGIFFTTIAWKSSSGDIITQICPYEFKRAEDAKSVSFPNEKTIVSASKIRTDERSRTEDPIIVAEYNEKNGVLRYTYNGPRYKDNPDEDLIIGRSIAINEYGEENWAIDTIIKAPDGCKRLDGKGDAYLFPIWLGDESRPIFGGSYPFEAGWKNEETGEIIVETITIEFDPGKVWMEEVWSGITKEEINRVLFVPVNDPEGEVRYETVESLKEYGINVDLFYKPGHIYSTFNDVDKIDIQTVADLEVMILPPDATAREENESIEEWIDRVYEETEYKFYKQGATGVGWYDPYNAVWQEEMMKSFNFSRTDRWSFRENIAWFEDITVNNITVWFTLSDGGNGHTVFVDWYKADENGKPEEEPSVREFVCENYDQLVLERTVDSVTEEELEVGGAVLVPTPVDDAEWKLTTNQFAQKKENDEVDAYYFRLEGDENTPDGEKVIYLPYSFIDPEGTKDQNGDGVFDYADALALKLNPKIHHYNDDHDELVEGEPLKGELTEYGIRFVVESFSPFVLDWSESGNSAVIGENGYATLGEALEEAKAGDVIELVANVEETMVLVSDEVTLDLNGYALITEYASIFGDIVDNSDDNSGRLVVNEKRFMSNPDNAQLPVKTETGYAFVELKMFVAKDYTVGEKHYDVVFEPRFEADSIELLKNNLENAGVEIAIVAHWQKDGMPRSQRFVFVQNLTDVFFSSYNMEKEKFGKMFTLKVNNAPEGISYETVVNSTVGVVIRENATETVN